jgi:DNA mismatch repair protein MutS
VTPGTYTDDRFLEAGSNNYLLALALTQKRAGLSWADLSTGEFFASEMAPGDVTAQISRIAPAEVLVAQSVESEFHELVDTLREMLGRVQVTARPDWEFDRETGYRALTRQFGTSSLAGFGVEEFSQGIRAAGAVLAYLDETQKGALGQMRSIRPVRSGTALVLDPNAVHCLELVRTQRTGEREGSLLSVMDSTKTAMGSRLLRSWLLEPLLDVAEINRRLDAVAELRDRVIVREGIRNLLGRVQDLSRLSARIASGRCTPRDLVGTASVLAVIPELQKSLGELGCEGVAQIMSGLAPLPEVWELVERAVVDNPPMSLSEGGVIRRGFDAELDELAGLKKEGRKWLAGYQAKETERTGIKSLKVGYNKVFGYYIEITNTYREKVPADYVRKQTLKNAERYITEELKQHEEKVLTAGERAVALEQKLFGEVRERVAGHTVKLQENAALLARLDVLCAFAENAAQYRYSRPVVDDSTVLEISDGRHPVLDLREEFVPNDTRLDTEGDRLVVITGPNMAGKSTYIRQVALLAIMAQMGSFVPAASMRLGVADRVAVRIGASDDLVRGRSTFMVEMNETADILHNATERSLLILDEVGRGTSTYDGLSLAWAVAEHIAGKLRARTLFATHYHQLTDLAHSCEGVRNCNVAVREWGDEVVFLHKIVEGAADRSYGIHVARLAGIPRDVLERALIILGNLEADSADASDMPRLLPRAERDIEGQLSLFEEVESRIAKRLRGVDINLTTPVEALNILREILEMLG